MSSTDTDDAGLRSRMRAITEVVVMSRHSCAGRSMHLPRDLRAREADAPERDEPDPLCHAYYCGDGGKVRWMYKETSVIPEGFYPWCRYCAEEAERRDLQP